MTAESSTDEVIATLGPRAAIAPWQNALTAEWRSVPTVARGVVSSPSVSVRRLPRDAFLREEARPKRSTRIQSKVSH